MNRVSSLNGFWFNISETLMRRQANLSTPVVKLNVFLFSVESPDEPTDEKGFYTAFVMTIK